MPKNKTQGVIFGLIMSYAMAIGMEVYNIAIKMGFNLNIGSFSSMTNAVFPAALVEANYLGCLRACFRSNEECQRVPYGAICAKHYERLKGQNKGQEK